MKEGTKVKVPSTLHRDGFVTGVIAAIVPFTPGAIYCYEVKTKEGWSWYSQEELQVDREV